LTGAWSRGDRRPWRHVVRPSTTSTSSVAAMIAASQPVSGAVSSSVNAIHSPRAARAPAFRFDAGPRPGPATSVAHGKRSSMSARVAAESPSSVTITSYLVASRVWAPEARCVRHAASAVCRFRVGMTTETSGAARSLSVTPSCGYGARFSDRGASSS
jgi:hypothetical protein